LRDRESGISETTLSRLFKRRRTYISDKTGEKLAKALKMDFESLIKISMGKIDLSCNLVEESFVQHYITQDIWSELADWLRSDDTSAKVKAHLLSAAEIGGFKSPKLEGALRALSIVSTPECDDGEHCACGLKTNPAQTHFLFMGPVLVKG